MPGSGSTSGGNIISISGSGFFPADDVVVHWGADDLILADFNSITVNDITLSTPAHSAGFITVSVETPAGISNSFMYEYTESAPPPIVFDFQGLTSFWPHQPTCGDDGTCDVAAAGDVSQARPVRVHDKLNEVPTAQDSGEAMPHLVHHG